MLSVPGSQSMIERIGREFQSRGRKAAAIAMTVRHAQIMLASEPEDDFVRRIFLEPVRSAQEAFRRLSSEAKFITMPYGGSTLSRVAGDGRRNEEIFKCCNFIAIPMEKSAWSRSAMTTAPRTMRG